jgi:hypothetical protein
MVTGTLYTVSAASLAMEADKLEKYAADMLTAWILIGQGDNYSKCHRVIRALRTAAGERSTHVRREILRDAGFTINTKKQLLEKLRA